MVTYNQRAGAGAGRGAGAASLRPPLGGRTRLVIIITLHRLLIHNNTDITQCLFDRRIKNKETMQ